MILSSETEHEIQNALENLNRNDFDGRFMALRDLYNLINNLPGDSRVVKGQTYRLLVDGLIDSLQDSNGEVQTQALKLITPVVRRGPLHGLQTLLLRICFIGSTESQDRCTSVLALKAVIDAIDHVDGDKLNDEDTPYAFKLIREILIPHLIGKSIFTDCEMRMDNSNKPFQGLLRVNLDALSESNIIDILADVIKWYGNMFTVEEYYAIQDSLVEMIQSNRISLGLGKKVVYCLVNLAQNYDDEHYKLFTDLISLGLLQHDSPRMQNLYLILVITLLRSSAHRLQRYSWAIVNSLFAILAIEADTYEEQNSRINKSNDAMIMDSAELKTKRQEEQELALNAIENYVKHCPEFMRKFDRQVLHCAVKYLNFDSCDCSTDVEIIDEASYDINYIDGTEVLCIEGDMNEDVNWRLRRNSARLLTACIIHWGNEHAETIVGQTACILTSRLSVAQESVQIEILAALTHMVSCIVQLEQHSIVSKAVNTFIDISQDLLRKCAIFVAEGNGELKNAAVILLTSLTKVKGVNLNIILEDLFTDISTIIYEEWSQEKDTILLVNILKMLIMLVKCCDTGHLVSYLDIVWSCLRQASLHRHAKVGVEAFQVILTYIEAIFGPDNPVHRNDEYQKHMNILFNLIIERINRVKLDCEVRCRAINALGSLLFFSVQSEWGLEDEKVNNGLGVLAKQLACEVTRTSAIETIEFFSERATMWEGWRIQWISQVLCELCKLAAKPSLTVRSASFEAIKALISNMKVGKLLYKLPCEIRVISRLATEASVSRDARVLSATLHILARLMEVGCEILLEDQGFLEKFFHLTLRGTRCNSVVNGLIDLGEVMARSGLARTFVKWLAERMKEADLSMGGGIVLSKVLGGMIVKGNDMILVGEFMQWALDWESLEKCCVGLMVLGEVAYLKGSSAGIGPELFTRYLTSDQWDEKGIPAVAAKAMGKAGLGPGNVEVYMGKLLEEIDQFDMGEHWLEVLREMLIKGETVTELSKAIKNIWNLLTARWQDCKKKNRCVECIGRLVGYDFPAYLKQFETILKDGNEQEREMVLLTIKYTFEVEESRLKHSLQGSERLVFREILRGMLTDDNVGNRKTGFNSLKWMIAKGHKVFGDEETTFLIERTVMEMAIDESLVERVKMGPFSYKIDLGYPLRLSAFELALALLDGCDEWKGRKEGLEKIVDGVIGGLEDEHEIRLISLIVLEKMIKLEGSLIGPRIGIIVERFRGMMKYEMNELTVKQDLEKVFEEQSIVMRLSKGFERWFHADDRQILGDEAKSIWKNFWQWINEGFGERMGKLNNDDDDDDIDYTRRKS